MPCLLLVAILSCVLLASPPVPETPPKTVPAAAADSPEVRALVQRVTARYGEAKTYRDTGTGTFTSSLKMPPWKIEFATAFIRDGGFRWRFQETDARSSMPFVVWSPDGRAWNSWWRLKGTTERFNSRAQAFVAPTGLSKGLALIVPDLLRPDGGDPRFFRGLTDRTIRGKEPIDGVECEVLEGRRDIDGTNFQSVTLWIDAGGAIRKYRDVTTIDPSALPVHPLFTPEQVRRIRTQPKVESTTEFLFTPSFDGPVSKEDVAFTPPPAAPR